MHLNMHVFKHGKPIYWVIGGLVIFYLFYRIASGHKSTSSSTGTVTTVSSGPSDASVAASSAITQAQIAANSNDNAATLAYQTAHDANAAGVAVATLDAQAHMYDTSAAADVGKYTAGLDAQTTLAGITAQMNENQVNAEYSFATAKVAAETNLAGQAIQASVINNSFATQLEMAKGQNETTIALSNNETKAFVYASTLANLGQVPSGDRDNLVALANANATGAHVTYVDTANGSFKT